MHELGIASAILDAVRKEMASRPGSHANKVGVRVGALSGVVPDALSFGFEALVRGTDLEPLALDIESMPRRQRCPDCDVVFVVKDESAACPRCARGDTVMVGGDELDVMYLEVEE